MKEEMRVSEKEAEGEVVVVWVKLDGDSRKLLTWALVKVARPSDRVVALHVIDSSFPPSPIGYTAPRLPPFLPIVLSFFDSFLLCVCDGGRWDASLLALVKAFDSVLSVYEGFCNLKQLKVCREKMVRSTIVEEAKAKLDQRPKLVERESDKLVFV